MVDRETFGWKVTLGNKNTGATVEREIHNYWDPERIETPEHIGQAAAAEEFIETRQPHVSVQVERL